MIAVIQRVRQASVMIENKVKGQIDLGFMILLGITHIQTIVALIVGGFIAAPIAAKLAGKLPSKTSFILLGILVIIWSIKILSKLL